MAVDTVAPALRDLLTTTKVRGMPQHNLAVGWPRSQTARESGNYCSAQTLESI